MSPRPFKKYYAIRHLLYLNNRAGLMKGLMIPRNRIHHPPTLNRAI